MLAKKSFEINDIGVGGEGTLLEELGNRRRCYAVAMEEEERESRTERGDFRGKSSDEE